MLMIIDMKKTPRRSRHMTSRMSKCDCLSGEREATCQGVAVADGVAGRQNEIKVVEVEAVGVLRPLDYLLVFLDDRGPDTDEEVRENEEVDEYRVDQRGGVQELARRGHVCHEYQDLRSVEEATSLIEWLNRPIILKSNRTSDSFKYSSRGYKRQKGAA